MNRRVWIPALVVASTCGGCNSSTGTASTAGGGADGAADDAPNEASPLDALDDVAAPDAQGDVAQPDAGDCSVGLSACPPSFAAACAGLNGDGGFASDRYVGTCGGLNAAVTIVGASVRICVYADGGAVQGVRMYDDIPSYCNDTSYEITGGEFPAICAIDAGGFVRDADASVSCAVTASGSD